MILLNILVHFVRCGVDLCTVYLFTSNFYLLKLRTCLVYLSRYSKALGSGIRFVVFVYMHLVNMGSIWLSFRFLWLLLVGSILRMLLFLSCPEILIGGVFSVLYYVRTFSYFCLVWLRGCVIHLDILILNFFFKLAVSTNIGYICNTCVSTLLKNKRISAVTLFFNRLAYLLDFLYELRSQTFPAFNYSFIVSCLSSIGGFLLKFFIVRYVRRILKYEFDLFVYKISLKIRSSVFIHKFKKGVSLFTSRLTFGIFFYIIYKLVLIFFMLVYLVVWFLPYRLGCTYVRCGGNLPAFLGIIRFVYNIVCFLVTSLASIQETFNVYILLAFERYGFVKFLYLLCYKVVVYFVSYIYILYLRITGIVIYFTVDLVSLPRYYSQLLLCFLSLVLRLSFCCARHFFRFTLNLFSGSVFFLNLFSVLFWNW